jgi:hypothetical protein
MKSRNDKSLFFIKSKIGGERMKIKKNMGFGLVIFLLLMWVNPVFSQIEVMHKRVETDGNAKGLAVQHYYGYLADGSGGLKIINMSNVKSFRISGSLQFHGSVIEQVAVSGDMAVLTDTTGNVHFVDVEDKMRPQLKWTLETRDIPRTVTAAGGKAFVIEYGDDPADPDYFSGIEVFSYYGTRAESIQLIPITGIRDVVITSKYVFAVTSRELIGFRRVSTGFDTTPAQRIDFPAGEEINSLGHCGHYLFAFGRDRLYVLGPIPISLFLFFFGSPFYGDLPRVVESELPLEMSIIDQAPIPGYRENRKADAAVLDYGGSTTSSPKIFILLTTLNSYGLFTYDWETRELNPFNILEFSTSTWIDFFDLNAATDGEVRIYDAAFPQYFSPGFLEGGVIAIGAIGGLGLAYAYISSITL